MRHFSNRPTLWTALAAIAAMGLLAGPAMAGDQGHSGDKPRNGMKKLDVKLPEPQFTGTPKGLPPGLNLDPQRVARVKDKSKSREQISVPQGVELISEDKPVTLSEEFPIIGNAKVVTDGTTRDAIGTFVELGPGKQWAQIDLQDKYAIHAIALWHHHSSGRVYRDVVVQVSDDKNFEKGVKTVFNNDTDNSLSLGAGKDHEYIENNEGRLLKIDGVKGRYVRAYSNGNTSNAQSHYIEIKVFGMKPDGSDKQTAQADGSSE